MQITALEYIHNALVLLVEYEMFPWHLAHFSGEGEVLVPAIVLGDIELGIVRVGAVAGVNEAVVDYCLVAEFAETVPAGLMLDCPAEIIRVGVIPYWAIGYCEALVPKIGHSTIDVRVRDHHHQCLVDVDARDVLLDIADDLPEVALSVAGSEGAAAL